MNRLGSPVAVKRTTADRCIHPNPSGTSTESYASFPRSGKAVVVLEFLFRRPTPWRLAFLRSDSASLNSPERQCVDNGINFGATQKLFTHPVRLSKQCLDEQSSSIWQYVCGSVYLDKHPLPVTFSFLM